MLGAIIGDIVGSRFEFDETPTENFTLFMDKPDCDYTDDTIMTVAVADAILNHRNYDEALRDWGRRYPRPKGSYGNMFGQWLQSDSLTPYNSWGNGAAMRVSAVGWLFSDYHAVKHEAKLSAICSHLHKEAIRGAQCVATLIYWLRTCRITKEEVENAVKRNFGYDIPPLRDIYKIGAQGHFDASCQETVPWAIRCFLDSDSFEDAIRKAVMARGDTDTKAAICGSIAEAFYEIPEHFYDKVCDYLEPDMLDVVHEFCTVVQKEMGD
ncbi:ADP-ribosylglycohydrolase [Bacteroidales bacterium KA00344]|nr:ADP-ribosylglycohydrolase [Bacteroidales bacterium KA00344]